MTYVLIALAFPLFWPMVSKILWRDSLDTKELFLCTAFGCVASLLFIGIGYAARESSMTYHEVWNGSVTGKKTYTVMCSHSYECRCRMERRCTGYGADKSCYYDRVCDTCYEHPYDRNWRVQTNVGDFLVSRIDKQGLREPPRWTKAKKGQPVATIKSYLNYIRASEHTVIGADESLSQSYKNLPDYPFKVYDYQYLDRVIFDGLKVSDSALWNYSLALELRELGPEKQANVILVFSSSGSPQYASALYSHWSGANKNDIVIVVGTPEYPKVSWVRVFSMSKSDMFNATLRDDLMSLGEASISQFMSVISSDVKSLFERRPMKDFEYLRDSIPVPTWSVVLAVILGVFVSLGSTFYLGGDRFDLDRWRW